MSAENNFENRLRIIILANFCGDPNKESTSDVPSQEAEDEPLAVGDLKTFWVTRKLSVLKQLMEEVDKEEQKPINQFRFYFLLQRLLSEPSAELKQKIEEAASRVHLQIANEAKSSTPALGTNSATKFFLEHAQAALYYRDFNKASELLKLATERCNLKSELIGRLGKRTRFQRLAVAQLILDTGSANPASQVSHSVIDEDFEKLEEGRKLDLPSYCELNDDTLLNKLKITDSSGNEQEASSAQLTVLQLVCLLIEAQLELMSVPRDELTYERVNAYIDLITSTRRCWAVQSGALALRCELERHQNRKVERACQQAEALADSSANYGKQEKDIKAVGLSTTQLHQRADLVLACGLSTFWEMRILYANILKSLGIISERFHVFESLRMWDEVIECYAQMKQLDKAESLIHRLLEERPNDSNLYVYLGDITKNVKHYEKAIEVSGDRNARAHRSLGRQLLQDHKYAEAYVHLRRSLDLQPIQLGVWFNAGHCAWKLEDYPNAIICYQRCVNLEPDHFEAWNNLSAAFIRTGQKERAFKLLQEALKFNYEHAGIWENYLNLAVDLQHISQAISTFHHLLDLKQEKWVDEEVLCILAKQILAKEDGASSPEDRREAKKQKAELLKLFGRCHHLRSFKWSTWMHYAWVKKPSTMLTSDENGDETESNETKSKKLEDMHNYLELIDRACVAAAQNEYMWLSTKIGASPLTISSKDDKSYHEGISQIVDLNLLLADERIRYAKMKGGDDFIRQMKYRVCMNLSSLQSKLKKQHEKHQGDKNLNELIEQVTTKINEYTDSDFDSLTQ